MTGRADFAEGRRLRTADLNEESAARAAALRDHLDLAHPGRGLVGAAVTAPGEATSIALVPSGPATTVRVTVPGAGEALRLAPGGHQVAGPLTSRQAPAAVLGALRLTPVREPAGQAAPWTIRNLDQRDDQGRLVGRELRVELDVPAGTSPADSRVAVGFRPGGAIANLPFEPAFVVDAGGTVAMTGPVLVAGAVSSGPIPADPADPRFAAALTDVVAQRIVGVAVAGTNPAIGLTATATSTVDNTELSVSVAPDRLLTHWGAALEIRRAGTRRFRLLTISGNTGPGQTVTLSPAVPWQPPLAEDEEVTLVVAVAAFDDQGRTAGQRAELTVIVEED